MNLRYLLIICFGILSICCFSICFFECKRLRKVLSKPYKSEDIELIKEENQELIKKLSRTNVLIILGFIFGVIASALLNHII